MKKLSLLVFIFFLVFLVSNISAADLKGRFGITGKGGVAIPFGDFGDDNKLGANTGYGFGAAGEYFVNNNISIGAEFLYDIHGVDVSGENTDVDVNWKITNYGAFLKYIFPTSSKVLLPYVKLDLGFYKPKLTGKSGAFEASASFSTKLGIAGGGGIAYSVSPNIFLSGELMFHNGFTSDAKTDGVKLDSDIQYVSIFAGVTFFVGGLKY